MAPYLALTSQVLVGLVFLTSTTAKVRSPAAYRDFRAWIGALPAGAGWMAGAVVATEVAIVVLLTLPGAAIMGMALAAFISLVFATETVVVIVRRLEISCRCFGRSTSAMGMPHVIRDLLLAGVAMGGAVAMLDRGDSAIAVPAVIVCAMAALFGAPLLIYFDDLVALFASQNSWARASDSRGGKV